MSASVDAYGARGYVQVTNRKPSYLYLALERGWETGYGRYITACSECCPAGLAALPPGAPGGRPRRRDRSGHRADGWHATHRLGDAGWPGRAGGVSPGGRPGERPPGGPDFRHA